MEVLLYTSKKKERDINYSHIVEHIKMASVGHRWHPESFSLVSIKYFVNTFMHSLHKGQNASVALNKYTRHYWVFIFVYLYSQSACEASVIVIIDIDIDWRKLSKMILTKRDYKGSVHLDTLYWME